MNATICKTADVRVGDRITEHDTPDGPFYAVLKVNAKSLVMETANAAELAEGESYPLPVRIAAGSSVLVAG